MSKRHQKKAETALKVDAEKIVDAIIAVKKEKKKVLAAAKQFEVPKTSLYRYIDKVEEHFPNPESMTKEDLTAYIEAAVGWKARTARNFIACTTCKEPYHIECVAKSMYGRI